MDTLAKSDVFFFITSIAVVLMTLLALVMLFYGIRLVRTALAISKKIKEESDNIANDIASIRAKVNEDGLGVRTLFKLFGGFFSNTIGKRKAAKSARSGKGSKSTRSSAAAADQAGE